VSSPKKSQRSCPREEVPEELPAPPKYIEVDESLLDDHQALEEIVWSSKRDAWKIFYDDPHNRGIIQESKLAVERTNKRKRYSQEKKFETFNCAHDLGRNIYTVKKAFYAALGNTQTGTWADFNLKMLRMIKGLEEVDIPMEILEMVRLEDQDAERGLKGKVEQRAVKASVDQNATILEFMLDREASEEPINVDADDDVSDFADDEAHEVQEPIRQDPRPKAVPRVQRTKKKKLERPVSKKRTAPTQQAARDNVIAACELLIRELSSFVETLKEDDSPNGDIERNIR
jgi:hypothetical protein